MMGQVSMMRFDRYKRRLWIPYKKIYRSSSGSQLDNECMCLGVVCVYMYDGKGLSGFIYK